MTLDLPRCPLRMCWACAAWCCVRREKVAFAFQKAKAQDASGSDINGIERGYNSWENPLGYGEHLGVSWDLEDDPPIYGNFRKFMRWWEFSSFSWFFPINVSIFFRQSDLTDLRWKNGWFTTYSKHLQYRCSASSSKWSGPVIVPPNKYIGYLYIYNL